MWQEFKKFAMRGNVIDLAVGVIIGSAFSGIVNSLVNDIIMPPIGVLLKGVDFRDFYVSLDGTRYPTLAEAQAAGAATLNYGVFINTLIHFLVVSFVIFIVVRQIGRMRKKLEKQEAAKAPETKTCEECLSEIPIKAKRCKYCTSIVKAESADAGR
jgi:large conductance mechanosensitive channel